MALPDQIILQGVHPVQVLPVAAIPQAVLLHGRQAPALPAAVPQDLALQGPLRYQVAEINPGPFLNIITRTRS